MQFTAKQIAKKLKGSIEGDENALIWKPCRIEEVDEGGITFSTPIISMSERLPPSSSRAIWC